MLLLFWQFQAIFKFQIHCSYYQNSASTTKTAVAWIKLLLNTVFHIDIKQNKLFINIEYTCTIIYFSVIIVTK